jgi:anti-anti-sigma regulatory factor
MGHHVDRRDEALRPTVKVRSGLRSADTPMTVIHTIGEHDYASREILAATLEGVDGHVVVDLTRCTFIDTAVIGALVGKALALGKRGYRLELVVPRSAPFARKVEQLGMRAFIPVHGDMPHVENASARD